MSSNWDQEVDIVVVGSGAGGMLTALVAAKNRAEVLIIEKAAQWGGTSATSGGGIWIPGSDQALAAGFEDNLDDAFRYVRGLSAANVPDANIRAYVDNAAAMLRWVTANTQVVYTAQPYPDYHAENPGGSLTGYRTHLPELSRAPTAISSSENRKRDHHRPRLRAFRRGRRDRSRRNGGRLAGVAFLRAHRSTAWSAAKDGRAQGAAGTAGGTRRSAEFFLERSESSRAASASEHRPVHRALLLAGPGREGFDLDFGYGIR